MLQPTGGMAASGIAVRPMEHSAFGIPHIFALERDGVSDTEGTYLRGDVDVVRNQQRLTGLQFDNEPLMPAALVVVWQDLRNNPFALDLNSAGTRFQRSGEFSISG